MENMHLHGNPEAELERLVSETGKQNLTKDNWGENDYSDVIKWKKAKEERVAPVFQEVIGGDAFKTVWCKPDGTGDAGRRSNSIIVFNPEKVFPFNLELKFDQHTKTEVIEIKKGKDILKASSGGKSLNVTINSLDSDEPFSEI